MNPSPAVAITDQLPNDMPAQAGGGILVDSVRLLATFAGLGAATLSFGTSATLITATAGVWIITGAVVASLWGAALTAWAVQSLRKGTPVWPQAALRTIPAGAALHLATVAAGVWWPGNSPRSLNITALSAAALELILLGCLGWLSRQSLDSGDRRPAPGALLIATFAAALTVAVIATPGLAATAAGQHAVPHSEHHSTNNSPPAGHHH